MPSRTASVSSFFCRSISFICKELIRYCFGANILPYWNRELDYFRRSQDGTHSSPDQCSHLRINALISGSMLSSRDQCSHLGINALISGSMLSSRDQRSHLRINALISGSMLSSQDQRSHLRINALISGSMLSSRDQCSHLGINALISGSWRRPTEARTCSDDAPAPQRNGALPPHSETRRQNHPRTESGKLRPLCAI